VPFPHGCNVLVLHHPRRQDIASAFSSYMNDTINIDGDFEIHDLSKFETHDLSKFDLSEIQDA